MASLLRRMYRKALDTELGGVGDEIVELTDRLDALLKRYHALQVRIGMRTLRSSRREAGDDDLEQVLRNEMAKEPKRAPTPGGWPEIEH